MGKKLFLFLALAALVFVVSGCKSDPLPNEETTSSRTSESSSDKRELLELEDYREHPVFTSFEEDDLPQIKSIDLPHTVMDEREESFYNGEKELDALVGYIKDTLNVEINDRWKVIVHYYTEDKTAGMVEFLYTVGEIDTNRSILFFINGDKYDTMSCKCLIGDFDEARLTARVNAFKSKYIQGKRDLQDGETFEEERTDFTYYINADKLVYSYAYFFSYDIGFINNDWGTVRLIDENGNAAEVR